MQPQRLRASKANLGLSMKPHANCHSFGARYYKQSIANHLMPVTTQKLLCTMSLMYKRETSLALLGLQLVWEQFGQNLQMVTCGFDTVNYWTIR